MRTATLLVTTIISSLNWTPESAQTRVQLIRPNPTRWRRPDWDPRVRPRAVRASYGVAAGIGDGSRLSAGEDGVAAAVGEDDQWTRKVQTPEVQALRQMLIDQYLKLGKDEEYARKEVDEFLADPSRSRTWVRTQELQDMPGWGFGRVPGSSGSRSAGDVEPSQLPLFVGFFLGGVLVKYVIDLISASLAAAAS